MLCELLTRLMLLALHMENVNAFPEPLTAKEEAEAVAAMEAGDLGARDRLIRHNLRLVAHIAKKYYASNEEPDELISIGTVGLIKAVNTYSSDKGVRLGTYAARCIDNEILMYFRRKKKTALDVSFDEPIERDGEGNPLTLMDIVSVDDSALDQIYLKTNLQKLRRFVREIENDREKRILILRYGLDGNAPMTQSEVAQLFGISRSYVSRLETKCLKRLRRRFDNE